LANFWVDLIHDERNSPNPYEASRPSAASARHAFELIKYELSFYIDDWRDKEGKAPTDEELQRAACALIYDSEDVAGATASSKASWLRDLLFSSDHLAQEARWTKVKGIDCWQQLKINGKTNIFELDPMEAELHDYVKARRLLGLTAMDSELQAEACKIIRRMEDESNHSSGHVVQFIIRLANSSTEWLAGFRQRAHLPRSEDLADPGKRSKDPSTIDSTVHNFSRLEFELAEYVRMERALGVEPTDADLQKQARMIIYEYEDEWNQTAADDPVWLAAFKQRHVVAGSATGGLSSNAQLPFTSTAELWGQSNTVSIETPSGRTSSPFSSGSGSGSGSGASNAFAQKSSGNCYRRLARELKKWVASTTSRNNPNCHIPSDEELQHQARWIIYEE
jgi:hypothetical protein